MQRLLVGRILARYEERGLKLVGLKLMRVDRDLAERHYAVHREKPFFKGLVDFITSGPLVAARPRGPERDRDRPSDERRDAAARGGAGSIRGDLAVETAQNLVHASDSAETAAAELALWFGPGELARVRPRDRSLGARPRGLSRPSAGSPSRRSGAARAADRRHERHRRQDAARRAP